MSDARFVLATDSCCDLPAELLEAHGVTALSFPFILDGVEHADDLGRTMPHTQYYARLREGAAATTSSVPFGRYYECFTQHASAGEALVFLAFSSGLSGSFETALRARETVLAENPGSTIHVIDTRRASIAQGVLVLEAIARRDAGVSADELAEWAATAVDDALGFFTLETLDHLSRGGRISDVARFAGSVFDVRPVLVFSPEGTLKIDAAVRGRKRSLKSLVDAFAEKSSASSGALVLVGHADSPDDAGKLEGMLREQRPDARYVRCDIGPVIGSHVGPGMVAVAFMCAR